MHKYAISILLVVASCTDKSAETTARASTVFPAPVEASAPDTIVAEHTIKPHAVALAEVPVALRLPGKLLEGWRWQDANGENLLVIFRALVSSTQQAAAASSAASAEQDMQDFERSAQLRARQYVRREGKFTELWRLQDAIAACPLDMTLRLQPGSTAITDLDHDGRSETTLMYALACRGDISSAALKLIMRAGPAKYALRGSTVVQYDSVPATQRRPTTPCCLDKLSAAQREEGNIDGYYQNEADFQTAPPAFLQFARQHWQKFSVETTDDHEDL
ncbi:M949_RS01915 family surface polysaccharide biosynthesis protein [Hymenobacter volaticus]|uniref:Lipoprotein n=1 Tax=Hymenobacter volaticus TaxID=2932254 RepID=A0ABY4G7C3_9BACT|nr:hypothetical protein [Hymenobacter volaticus]UOQ66665.1 hypothetical protein MUN86_01670 [Hymenobacter volaticus]